MKNIMLTEEIIRNALHKSINEFIVEDSQEEPDKNKRQSQLGKIGKSLWNGVKMYMDYKTNGAWNRKYNQYAKGNGFAVGSFYVNKWLQYHYKNIQEMLYGDNYGMGRTSYTLSHDENHSEKFTYDWKRDLYYLNNEEGKYEMKVENDEIKNISFTYTKGTTIKGEITPIRQNNSYEIVFYYGKEKQEKSKFMIYANRDNSTPEYYIANNCTPNSFNKYTQNTLGDDSTIKKNMISYINDIQEQNRKIIEKLNGDPNADVRKDRIEILNMFTLQSFYNFKTNNKDSENSNNGQPTTNNNGYNTTSTTHNNGYNSTSTT